MSLIGVAGYAQHGKDSIGAHLMEQGFVRFAFADALKSMALVLNPIVRPGIDGSRLNDTVLAEGWEYAKTIPEVRRFLQVLGTEAVRGHLGEDSWVTALDLAIGRAGDPENVVITDVRFPNEAEYVKDMGGTMLRVTRKNEDGTPFDNGISKDHPSEAHIASLPVDYDLIAPSGRLDVLYSVLDFVVSQLRKDSI